MKHKKYIMLSGCLEEIKALLEKAKMEEGSRKCRLEIGHAISLCKEIPEHTDSRLIAQKIVALYDMLLGAIRQRDKKVGVSLDAATIKWRNIIIELIEK